MVSNIGKLTIGLYVAILIAGCGGEGSSTSSGDDNDTVQITGAGIKGPLAFADVKIFTMDPSFPELYDRTSPISVAITNQYAEINGLSIPRRIRPPFILEIDGSNSVDLNTGEAPVIDTLVTVISKDMLANNRPIYATPLTTLVFHMARLSTVTTSETFTKTRNSARETRKGFMKKRKDFMNIINNAASLVSSIFMIGKDHDIDLFRSPLIINGNTTDLAGQEQAVYHRATVEAFAANVYALAQQEGVSTDAIIDSIALDIHNDGVIDNADNGASISSKYPLMLSQSPMSLLIPNTNYQIREIMQLMEEERIYLGTNMDPEFFVNEIEFSDATTKTITGSIVSDTTLIELTNNETTNNNDPTITTTKTITHSIASDTTLIELTENETTNNNDPTITTTRTIANTIASDTTLIELTENEITTINSPTIILSSEIINFESLSAGEISIPVELTLTNSGSAPLKISDISISPSFIEANNCSNYVPAGGNCIFDIQFIPTTTGRKSGKLEIKSNAISTPNIVSLHGAGVDAGSDVSDTTPISTNPNSPNIILYNDLNSESRLTYTEKDLQDHWGFKGKKDLYGAIDIVADPHPIGTHNNAMRVFYAADVVGRKGVSGTRWPIEIEGHDELYLAYDVFFEEDAEFVRGGKLPRLQSTDWEGSSSGTVDGTNRWNAGLMWREGGKLVSYVYHAGMSGRYGDVRGWDDGVDGQVYFKPGQWHSVEVRIVMNTPGVLDGRMQGWFDGKLAFDSNEFMWRMPGGEHLDIGQLIFVTFYGGADSSWAPSTDQHTYFDNVVISTKPITH